MTCAGLTKWCTGVVLKLSCLSRYYRGAAAAVLVLDVTNIDSFEKVRSWVEELKANAPGELVLSLACNKVPIRTSYC